MGITTATRDVQLSRSCFVAFQITFLCCDLQKSVRPSAAAVSAAAAAAGGGCREEDVGVDGGCSNSACTSATTIPEARLVDIWPPICICMLSGGSA